MKSRPASAASRSAPRDGVEVRFLEDNAPWHKGDIVTVSAAQAEKFVDRQRIAVLVMDDAG